VGGEETVGGAEIIIVSDFPTMGGRLNGSISKQSKNATASNHRYTGSHVRS
jgi:hypothetical protein